MSVDTTSGSSLRRTRPHQVYLPRPATRVGGVSPHETSDASSRRPRLHHVDAMRPVKQVGVVSTHAFSFYAPASGAAVTASVLLTHVTRFAFVFISAAMLVYAYPQLDRRGLRTFWRRRLLAVGLPYLAWTLVYFSLQAHEERSVGAGLLKLGYLVGTGYYQLYFLLLLLELCVVFPGVLWLLRRTEGHHLRLLAGSLALQLVLMSLAHWGLEAGFLGKGNGMTELWNYEVFIIAGALLAWHYDEVHGWLWERRRAVLLATAGAAVLAEGAVLLASTGTVPALAGNNPAAVFQPVTVPLYLGLTVSGYLLGVKLVGYARRRRWFAGLLRTGVDDSYGLYLDQLLVFQLIDFLGFKRLETVMPWPCVTFLGVVVVVVVGMALASLLARLPGAKALAGRPRVVWRSRPCTVQEAPSTHQLEVIRAS